MCGLMRILLWFCNELNKFNNAGAQMLDSIDYIILKLLLNYFSFSFVLCLYVPSQQLWSWRGGQFT